MRLSRQNRKGFSLTEATIAMVVLSVAAAGVILPYSTGAAMNTEGARRTLGAKLAADFLEEAAVFAEIDYDNMDLVYDTFQDAGSVSDADLQAFTDPVYSRYARRSICTASCSLIIRICAAC